MADPLAELLEQYGPPPPRRRGPQRLGGVREVAALLGVSKQRASQLAKGDRWGDAWFPEPLAVLAAGPVWDLRTIEDWMEERGRLG